jgi:ubiquinone/menaquinone biosynthesis C-methylase UbiE
MLSNEAPAFPVSRATRLASYLDLLAAPGGGTLIVDDRGFVIVDEERVIPITESGIPLFAQSLLTKEASQQQQHYDRIAEAYVTNLSYPHTQEYMAYLDDVLLERIGAGDLGTVAELCCGHGEALFLPGLNMSRYVGIDVSRNMLEKGLSAAGARRACFVQGDATKVPLRTASIDTVLMLGGVHHVPDRVALFSEISRILKPGGRFVFREPVSDFFVWRAIRWVVYRISPMLDHATESPLEHGETLSALTRASLELQHYRTCGFLGFCFFMNSDVLVFNRLFRFLPGIRQLTRFSTKVDEALLGLPGLSRAGLQVVGEARPRNLVKPSSFV